MVHQHQSNSSTINVIYNDLVKNVRPFILCCVVKDVNLRNGNLRKFLQIQTKLHESFICGKREKSSIGTHDLLKLAPGGFIQYTVKSPNSLNIIALGRSDETTALELIGDLKLKAETFRNQKKRKVKSGIGKYLHLVENKESLACIEDATGNVICLPPLTNGDLTKISTETSHVFIEITSSSSMTDCYKTMEELLKEMLLAGFGRKITDGDRVDQLRLEPVRIIDCAGNLKTIYPSTTDLQLDVNP